MFQETRLAHELTSKLSAILLSQDKKAFAKDFFGGAYLCYTALPALQRGLSVYPLDGRVPTTGPGPTLVPLGVSLHISSST